ncbi:hypothetical protein LZQ00_08610 [Sphingobacterium sp. SRCM116780]|uniref:hypothetical protein n=1 Tax=Sphingobacterium sp. SRCM116780 TaxID=2907623 RepID=UPI001F301AE9|nr:hypothetical protein [Sphingobacterium sp. SRCM116780]UIR57867.1 hypothetical protein LZQ00_08610 [Sphingobacterium sp. SRCM116780]
MNQILKISILFLVLVSCKDNKDKIKDRSYYYSLENNENIVLSFNYDTLITDKGFFLIKHFLDHKKSNIYHLSYKDKVMGMVIEDPTDDKTSIISLDIDSTFTINNNDWFKLYRTDNKQLSQLSLTKTKLEFLKKYKIIE